VSEGSSGEPAVFFYSELGNIITGNDPMHRRAVPADTRKFSFGNSYAGWFSVRLRGDKANVPPKYRLWQSNGYYNLDTGVSNRIRSLGIQITFLFIYYLFWFSVAPARSAVIVVYLLFILVFCGARPQCGNRTTK
jgi:hypothetical protein